MPNILSIDTATTLCSVSIFNEHTTLALEEVERKNSHSEVITLLIEAATKKAKIALKDLDAVAVSAGPGSYTGLRIGASAAKAICYTFNIPLIAYNTLKNIAFGIKKNDDLSKYDIFGSAIDARREEIYISLYNMKGENIYKPKNIILTENIFLELFSTKKIVLSGDGPNKVLKYHKKCNIIIDQISNSQSNNLTKEVIYQYKNQEFVEFSLFEPNYIKPFYTTNRKN